MSALSVIRNNIGLVVVVIAISLLGFILTDALGSLGGVVQGVPKAGSVAGEEISQNEFITRYNNQMNQYGGSLPESQRFFVQDQVWNQMVNEIVYEKELDRAGIDVTGAELYDMFTGEEIHPIVRQQLSQGGAYDREAVKGILDQMLNDPQRATALKEFEDFLRISRSQERYQKMIGSGFISSNGASNQAYLDQERKVDISYLGINYSQIPDSAVTVTNSDLNSYLNRNAKKYQQEDQFIMKYVKFDILPTKEDSISAFNQVLKFRASFEATTNDSAYVSNKTRIGNRFSPSAPAKTIGQLPEDLQDSIVGVAEGSVVGPFLDGDYYKLYKLIEKRTEDEPSVSIQHLLITAEGAERSDTVAARNKAAQLRRQANASNFADLVNENSKDFASKIDDGVLGWYRKGTYGEDFDAEVARASVGSIIGPIKTSRGFHVVRILDKTRDSYKVSEVESEIYPRSNTSESVYKEANKFAALAASKGNIDSAAVASGLSAVQSSPLGNDAKQILGLPQSQGTRQLVIWGIDADKNDISKIEKVGDQVAGESFVVAQMISKTKKGTKSVQDVRAQIERLVINEKKAEIILDKLKGISSTDLNQIKDQYGAGAFVSTASDISFSSSSIPGIGNDNKVIGRVAGLSQNEVSEPIQGQNGVFIIQATAIKEPAALDEDALAQRVKTESQSGSTSITSKIQLALTKLADVDDTRHKIGY